MPDQMNLLEETLARDEALDMLEEKRALLVAEARRVRDEILDSHGTANSVAVFARMRRNGWGDAIDAFDKRWMGAVFRASEGLRRVRWVAIGSHRRPVAVWERGR